MKVRKAGRRSEEKVELMMTPMIDIVFQLLIFFIMTFKIVAPEGDFNIKMPLGKPSQGLPPIDQAPPMTVRLKAARNGQLVDIQFGQRSLGTNFQALREQIRQSLGDDAGPAAAANTEVELDCDYQLRYEYVVDAITAVTGYVDPKTGQIKKVADKIKFAPPRGP
jgi:biopolymer transport protein ExbD